VNPVGAHRALVIEHLFVYVRRMSELELLRVELEQRRRSLAMLPTTTALTREQAIAVIERCQHAIDAARRIG
jgi:hypothetical protein